jgi:hypothetical protein
MDYNDEKYKLLIELQKLNVLDLNYLMKEFGLRTPEDERDELRKSRKEKINEILGDDIQ